MKTSEFIDILNQLDSNIKTSIEINGVSYNYNGNIYVSNSFKSNKLLLVPSDELLNVENLKQQLEDKNKSYIFKFLSADGKERYEFDNLKISKRPKENKIILK